MLPDEFHDKWIAFHDNPFVFYNKQEIKILNLPVDDEKFLSKSGLPQFSAPHLYFDHPKNISGGLYTKIGEDAFDNFICVDKLKKGRVLWIDKDNHSNIRLFNNSIRSMCETLLLYQEMVEKAISKNGKDTFLKNNIPNYLITEFESKVKIFDADVSKQKESFWGIEILRLKSHS